MRLAAIVLVASLVTLSFGIAGSAHAQQSGGWIPVGCGIYQSTPPDLGTPAVPTFGGFRLALQTAQVVLASRFGRLSVLAVGRAPASPRAAIADPMLAVPTRRVTR